MFNVGDRVITKVEECDAPRGAIGTVVLVKQISRWYDVGVRLDNPKYGLHNCAGKCEPRRGLFYNHMHLDYLYDCEDCEIGNETGLLEEFMGM